MSAKALKEAMVVHDKRLLLLRNALVNVYSNPEPSPPPCTPPPLGPKLSCYNHGYNRVGRTCRGCSQGTDRIGCRNCFLPAPAPYLVNPARHRRSEVTSQRVTPSLIVNNEIWGERFTEQYTLDHLPSKESSLQVTSRHFNSTRGNKPIVSYFSNERDEDIRTTRPDREVFNRPTVAQLSFAYLKLREEVPAFFSGHHSYDMYSSNMRFENNLSAYLWRGHGVNSYRLFLGSSRLALQSVYTQLELDLMKITKDIDVGKIEARWRVRGSPRYTLIRRQRVVLEGFSTFMVNSDGHISMHTIDRVMPPHKEPMMHRTFHWLAQLGLGRKVTLPQPEL